MIEVNIEHTEESTSAKVAHTILSLIRDVLMILIAIAVGTACGTFAGILTYIGILLILSTSIIKLTGKDIISLAACSDLREQCKKAERKITDVSTFIMLIVYICIRFFCG